jgi:hypothetical protein
MAIYEVNTAVKPAESLVIPEHIDLPQLRYAAPPGTLAKGDVIEGTITVKDKDGNLKPLEFEGFKVVMNEWPSDIKQEILSVLYLNFVISNKPESQPTIE